MENTQRLSNPGLVAIEQKRSKNGTITKIRSITRSAKDSNKSLKSKNALEATHTGTKFRDLTTRSDTRDIHFMTQRSDPQAKIVPLSGATHSKHKGNPGDGVRRADERVPVQPRSSQSPQLIKLKANRAIKATPVTKQHGDNSKTQKIASPHPGKDSEARNRHSAKAGDKSTSQKTRDTSGCKHEGHVKHRETKKPAKPPQFPSEDDVHSTAKTLKARGYLMEGKLGEGTYAKVRRAYSYHHNCRVAIKIVSRSRLNARFQQKFLPRELKIVQSISHPNIIKLLEMFENKGVIFLIMELARHGDLLEYVQKKHALRDSEARTVFTQILSAVDHLHVQGIFHRDLKCENILLDWGPTGLTAKLTDFGFARDWTEAFKPCSTYCGSAAYASPEILQAIPYDPHWADIWSLGVVLYITITGRMPFDDSNIKEALDDMHHNRLNFSRRRLICIEVQRLLRAILTYNPRERPGTQEIRNSPWMRGRCTMTRPSPQISNSVSVV